MEEMVTTSKRSVTCLIAASQLYPDRTIGYEGVSLMACEYSCGGQRSGGANDAVCIKRLISRRRNSSVKLLCVDGWTP